MKQSMVLTNAIYDFVEMRADGAFYIDSDEESNHRSNELLIASREHYDQEVSSIVILCLIQYYQIVITLANDSLAELFD